MLIQVEGYEFKTIKAAAKHYNRAYTHVIEMLKKGRSIEQALGLIIRTDTFSPPSILNPTVMLGCFLDSAFNLGINNSKLRWSISIFSISLIGVVIIIMGFWFSRIGFILKPPIQWVG
jgi:hypothetical protein